MGERAEHLHDRWDPEPRWPAFIAIVAVGGLYLALPTYLTIGPRWLFPAVVMALLVPTVISHRAGKHHINRILGLAVNDGARLASGACGQYSVNLTPKAGIS